MRRSPVSHWLPRLSDDTFRHRVYPELIHAAGDAGYVLHATGGIGAGAMMIASLAALRAAVVPSWLGVAFGVLALFSIFFFPRVLIAVWVLLAGWLLFRSAPAPERAVPTAP